MFSQDYNDFLYGKLIDATSREPVVFATVRVKGKALGVISNNDGGFQIPIEFRLKGEELEISSMGYQTMNVSFSDLQEGSVNQIFVKPATFQLNETVVEGRKKRKPSAKQIIQYALDRIPDNFQNNAFGLVGYYRDYQLKDKAYINLNESLIKVIDEGFAVNDYQSMQFGLFNYETNRNFKIDSFAAKPYDYNNWDKFIPNAAFGENYAPNELVLLFIHDAIRNHDINAYSYVYTMTKDFIKEHRFSKVMQTSYGDQKVYQIDLSKTELPFRVEGTIYIDEGTYAIRKLDYAAYKQKPDENSPTKFSNTERDLLYEILVEYQWYNDLMYLNYISFHNQFKLVRPPKFFIKEVIFENETKQMRMILNKPAANRMDLNFDDFKVFYENKWLKVKKVVRVNDVGDTFLLSFPRKSKQQRKRLDLIFSEIEDREKASLGIVVNKMVDAEGNFLAERKTELMDQFREFFTQKIIRVDEQSIQDSLLVKKKFSLGHPSQTKFQTEVDQEFWLNTPLKQIEQ